MLTKMKEDEELVYPKHTQIIIIKKRYMIHDGKMIRHPEFGGYNNGS
jgi:hypothetical protein